VNRRVVVSHLSRGNALFPFTRQAQALPAELGHSPVKSWPDAKGCNHLSVQVTQAALMQGGIEPLMLRSEIDKVGGPVIAVSSDRSVTDPNWHGIST
jgi:hypothetical protein